ncbi:MAG: hypothetical protein RLZZ561_2112 [Pseudomonadota bacterium]|jgi:hypothetical protein
MKIFLFSLLALSAAPVAAQSLPTNSAPEQSAADADPNKIICKRFADTGSLVKKSKVCRTRAEWSRATEDAQKEGERLLSRSVSIPNG